MIGLGWKDKVIVLLQDPHLEVTQTQASGEILSIDKFGNLITTLGKLTYQEQTLHLTSWIDGLDYGLADKDDLKIRVNDQHLLLVDTFKSLARSECGAVIGSSGLLEIVANQDSAGSILNIGIGEKVILYWGTDS